MTKSNKFSQDKKATTTLSHNLYNIVSIARLAPSVHNTQPWLVSCKDKIIVVRIDPRHQLSDGDPTGRQTFISLGIFAQAIVLAAAKYGYSLTGMKILHNEVKISFSNSDRKFSKELLTALKTRASDRSIYKPALIEPSELEKIGAVESYEGVRVSAVTESSHLKLIADLTGKAIGLALSNTSFRRELSRYLVAPWSRKVRGISTKSLYLPSLIGSAQPWLVRQSKRTRKEADLERKRWLSASAVFVLLAPGDTQKYWFAAGRTYLNLSLAIEMAGLSQATSAGIAEASNYHEDVEESLGTNLRILSLIRVGHGSTKRHYSPRVSAESLITSN